MSIQSFELEPTKDNLIQTLLDDSLDRNIDVWRFARLCNTIDGKYSIALEAKWGQGKTFFVRQVQMLIESFNPFFTTVSNEDKEKIQRAFSKYIGAGDDANVFDAQVCAYYDAWANDNDGDPILSLVYAILKGTAQRYKFKKNTDIIKAATLISDYFTGKNLTDIVGLLRDKDPLADLKAQKEIHPLVDDLVDALLNEQGNRLIIFIDELDRCKPDYAVQLLERIKHYFSNKRITFVFSVNIDELQHTIKCHYGEGYDACRYLDRFFDLRIALPPANMSKYYQTIGMDSDNHVFERVCKAVIEEYGLGLREIEKYYRTVKNSAYKPTHGSYHCGFGEEYAQLFAYCFFVPVIIGLRMIDPVLYNKVIDGYEPQPILRIIHKGDLAHTVATFLCKKTFTTDKTNANDDLDNRVIQAYHAVFDNDERNTLERAEIGNCTFSQAMKDDILRVASMLSKYATYDN